MIFEIILVLFYLLFSLSAIEILTTTTIAACNAAWIDSAAFVSVVVTCTSAESTISIYSSET